MHSWYIFLLSIIFFITNATRLKGQYEGSLQIEGMIEASYYRNQFDWTITTGTVVNYWFTDNIAINYEIQLGYDNKHGFALNTGMGQVAAGFIFSELATSTTISEEGLYALGIASILALIVPEGITFAVNPNGELVFMPYLMPLEIHYFHDDTPHFRCSFELGLKLHYEFDNGMALRPKLGLRYIYDKQRLGIQVGIGVMFIDSNF